MACPHGNGPPDRCSICLESRGELDVQVQRVEIAGPITPAPGPRSIYGRRGGNARRVTRRAEQPGDDEDVN